MAFLNLRKQENAELAAEVADKFGADKIGACFAEANQVKDNEPLLNGHISCLLYVGDGPLDQISLVTMPVPVLAQISGDMCVRQSLTPSYVHGVTGYGVNKRIGKLQFVREKLNASGIPVKIRQAVHAWNEFKLSPDGLLPVVVQEASTDQVLMVAYMNEEAYNRTVSTGRMTYWSRSRQEIWVKGLTSGHFQYVHSLTADCDMDTLLAKVEQIGAACHTGSHSCFFNEVLTEEGKEAFNPQKVLLSDYQTIVDRRDHPKKGSYTNYLFDKGIDKMLKKLGEEATEIVIAAKNPNPNEIVYEISDYLYHLMVVMAEKGITWEDVAEELARRQKKED
jgi:phosphoribosyl-ATP pyrophosphohydrolase/phosphoribosyl-AMP cyclohydrolase